MSFPSGEESAALSAQDISEDRAKHKAIVLAVICFRILCRLDESAEQRLGMFRVLLYSGWNLHADEEGMSLEFNYLHEAGLGVPAGGLEPRLLEVLEVFRVELVAVAVDARICRSLP